MEHGSTRMGYRCSSSVLRRPVPVPLCSSRCKQTRCALVGGFVQISALQQELFVSEAIHYEHQLYMFPCAVQVPALEQELLVPTSSVCITGSYQQFTDNYI